MTDRVVGWMLGGVVLAQGIAMALLARLEPRGIVQVVVVTGAISLAVTTAWRIRSRLNHRIDMLLVMAAFGGLGMLAGWWVDLGFSAPPRDAGFHQAMGHGCGGEPAGPAEAGGGSCHGGASTDTEVRADAMARGGDSPWSMVTTWMTGLMLLAAIPPGLKLTRCAMLARTGWRRWVSTHIVGNALMVVGMIWLCHWVGPGIARLTGSSVVGGHLGMLLGMLVGMELGMFAGEAVLGLAPWREWRWGDTTHDDLLTQASRRS
jgi:hypothetical protein